MNELLSRAILFATSLHINQTTFNGEPYILHPLHVMNNVKTIKQKIIAVLHDVVEDTDITVNTIRSQFDNEIADAVSLLTKVEGIKYEDYIENLKTSNNKDAIEVKIQDLKHNLDITRNTELCTSNNKLNLYLWALNYLTTEN